MNKKKTYAHYNSRLSLRPTAEDLEQRNILKTEKQDEEHKLDIQAAKRYLLRKVSRLHAIASSCFFNCNAFQLYYS